MHEITRSLPTCLAFLRDHGLLLKSLLCRECRLPMKIEKVTQLQDKERFRCPNSNCRRTASIRTGSFFADSKINLPDLVRIIYYWAKNNLQRQIAYEGSVSERSMVEWCENIRAVCSTDLIQYRTKLGGISRTVICDETAICKRNPFSNRAARYTKTLWILGGIDDLTGEIFLEIIPPDKGRTKEVFADILSRNIAPGTTIITDCHKSYNCITELPHGWTHRTVNHSQTYVAPDGTCSNKVEVLWACLKQKFKQMKGARRTYIASYIDEFMWRRGKNPNLHFLEMLKSIAKVYPLKPDMTHGGKSTTLINRSNQQTVVATAIANAISSTEATGFTIRHPRRHNRVKPDDKSKRKPRGKKRKL